jgi:hypothetical protein
MRRNVFLRALERRLRMTPYVDSYRMFGCPLCSFGIKLQLLLETAGPALPHRLLGYNPAAISLSDAAETPANDVALCGETRSAVGAAWTPTSSWQINKLVAYRAGGSTLYIHISHLRQSKDCRRKIERAGADCILFAALWSSYL